MTSRSAPTWGSALRPADLPPAPTADPEEIRRVVDEVLSRPEYARAEPGPLQRAFDRVLEALAQAFDAAAGTGVGRVAGLAVLAALVALLAWLVARALGRMRWERRQQVALTGAPGRSPEAWLAEALAHERAGELAASLRCHYRALLAWLAERGVVEEVPGRTTGEYRRAVAEALPGAAEAFGGLTTAFERAWYGQATVTRAGLDAAVAAAEQVRATAARPAEARA